MMSRVQLEEKCSVPSQGILWSATDPYWDVSQVAYGSNDYPPGKSPDLAEYTTWLRPHPSNSSPRWLLPRNWGQARLGKYDLGDVLSIPKYTVVKYLKILGTIASSAQPIVFMPIRDLKFRPKQRRKSSLKRGKVLLKSFIQISNWRGPQFLLNSRKWKARERLWSSNY